jgi:C-terminal processing protease CtpA/Prc
VCPDVLEGLGLAGAELELSDERTAPRAPPRFLERRDEPRWIETLGRVLYVAYSVTRGDVSDLAAAIDGSAGAVVLDLRLNGGGDNKTYGPLLDALTRVRELRVLIGRVTFSAAMQLVVDLERRTSALFVGEPTGASPNHFGDAEPLTLTQTQVCARVATIAWTTAGEDERLAREPDVAVALDSEAFFAGRDPVLEAALETLD